MQHLGWCSNFNFDFIEILNMRKLNSSDNQNFIKFHLIIMKSTMKNKFLSNKKYL